MGNLFKGFLKLNISVTSRARDTSFDLFYSIFYALSKQTIEWSLYKDSTACRK